MKMTFGKWLDEEDCACCEMSESELVQQSIHKRSMYKEQEARAVPLKRIRNIAHRAKATPGEPPAQIENYTSPSPCPRQQAPTRRPAVKQASRAAGSAPSPARRAETSR